MHPLGPRTVTRARQSLWKGPIIDGITYSLLCKFLQCPERFRLQVVEGLREPQEWNYHMEYGSLFHAAEEARVGGKPWQPALNGYYHKLLARYPASEKDITKWYLLCKMQFPLYMAHWEKHQTEQGRVRIYEEKAFNYVYHLKNGRTIRLRGKLDSAFSLQGWIWLQENKTKGEIDQEGIATTVDQNLQTMLYHQALRHLLEPGWQPKIAGTIYNVIRRPLSDRNSIKQKKKESQAAFIARAGEQISSEPTKHFFRWIVSVTPTHIERFRRECLEPVLNRLLDWWEGFHGDPFSPENNALHFRYPFGAYHSLERGYRGDYFRYLTTGSKAGLEKTADLFPELK